MYNMYQQYPQNYTPYSLPSMTPTKQEIIKVHGEDGAKAFQLAPNSSVLLLDDISPLVWLKITDGAGYPTITPYTITPYQKEPEVDVRTLEERIKAIEVKLNESNNANVKQTKSHE